MNINYEYMQDSNFLFKIDCLQTKTQYIKIVILDWYERPVQAVVYRHIFRDFRHFPVHDPQHAQR